MFRKIVAVEDPLINDEARKALYDFAQQVIIYNDSPLSEDELICRIGDADAVFVTFKTQIGRKAIEANFTVWPFYYQASEEAKMPAATYEEELERISGLTERRAALLDRLFADF